MDISHSRFQSQTDLAVQGEGTEADLGQEGCGEASPEAGEDFHSKMSGAAPPEYI